MNRKYLYGAGTLLGGAMLFGAGQATAQQQSASAQAMLEEIVVTTRRREESLMDLPLSVAAFNAEAIEAQGILSIEDASDFVPNVTLTQSDRQNNTRIVIRGIGGGHPDPVFVFGSGMYIDGHYIPNSLGGYMSTMDIERIELLRGPQGTLFGKNVTGGAVNIITAKPGPEFDANFTLRMAEDGQEDARGMINFPISDNIYARLSAATESFDGYYFNRNLNTDSGGTDRQSLNAAIRFEPTDNMTIDFNVNQQKYRDDNLPIQCNPLDGSAPSWGTSRGGFGREDHLSRTYYHSAGAFSQYEPGTMIPTATAVPLPAARLAADGTGYREDHQAACASDAATGTYITSSDMDHYSDLDVDSAFLSLQYSFNESLGMKFNTSYRKTDYDYLQDRDGTFYDIDNIGTPNQFSSAGGDIGQDNLTRGWELLLEGEPSDRLSFTVGINSFYELAKNGDGACRQRFAESGFAAVGSVIAGVPQPAGTNTVNDGVNCDDVRSGLAFDLLPNQFLPFINTSRIENESIGIFGHITYDLNDNWVLDLGARWTEDDREFWNMESGISGCDIQETIAGGSVSDVQFRTLGGPNAGVASGICDFNWDVTFDSTILGGFYNQASDTFDEVTPMLSLTRNLAGGGALDSGMVYFLYSEGFLTGGFNTEVNSNLPAISQFLSYQPETVTNYEIGFKGSLAGGRVQIMADIFFMDYADKQEDITLANPDNAFGVDEDLGIRTNVASVDISGIEFEMRANAWDGGFISLDIGLLDNEYGDFNYPDPACPVGATCPNIDESDTTIVDLSADYTLNLGIEHQFTLSNGATITPRMNVYASDSIDYLATSIGAPPSNCNQDSYTKVGTRVTYVPPTGNWRASLYGNNITDEEIFEACTQSRGVFRYRHERPAFWGLEFTMDFGQT